MAGPHPAEAIKVKGVTRWRVGCGHCGEWHYHRPAEGTARPVAKTSPALLAERVQSGAQAGVSVHARPLFTVGAEHDTRMVPSKPTNAVGNDGRVRAGTCRE